jgi:cytochrome d ubiquinol oxidase subunit II
MPFDSHALLMLVWYLLIGLILILYVVLDGFDLGVGILSLLRHEERQRGLIMNSISGVWGANETWLVLLGGALFGAFPLAYGLILHALYVPIMFMLFGLIFRGIAFEFREHARYKPPWNLAFGVGSLVTAIAQGLALGGLIQGIEVDGRVFGGGSWDWLSVFSVVVAIGVVSGYALLGATYLIMKTEGPLQRLCRQRARGAAGIMIGVALAVTVWTPLLLPRIAEQWFALPNLLWLLPLPALAALACVMLWRALRRHREHAPFVWSLVVFVTSFIGLAASLYPTIVPPAITLREAAASGGTLTFMLAGIGLLLPVMLLYNAFQYRVFSGKTRRGGGH